jgi:KUP system potassium uptake protein
MVFWSWARELEDSFDDSNAEKLSRIITRRALDEKARLRKPAVKETEGVSNDDLHLSHSVEADAEDELSTEGSEHDIPPLYLRAATGESTVLTRIPVMAIFHRNDAANRGVPHSFVSFLQRYPALPEIVVSSRLTGGRRQPSDQHSDFPLYTDCWRPSRARGGPLHRQQGPLAPRILRRDIAVSCTNIAAQSRSRRADDRSVGYLDSKTPSLPALLPYLTSIEARSSASPAPVIDALTAAAHNATHIIPSYTVISRRSGWVPWVWVRRILIEEIYGRARVIFPDYVAAPDAMQDEWVVQPNTC